MVYIESNNLPDRIEIHNQAVRDFSRLHAWDWFEFNVQAICVGIILKFHS